MYHHAQPLVRACVSSAVAFRNYKFWRLVSYGFSYTISEWRGIHVCKRAQSHFSSQWGRVCCEEGTKLLKDQIHSSAFLLELLMFYFIYVMHLSIRLIWRSQFISVHLYIFIPVFRGARSFHRSWKHLKILHDRRVTWSKFLTEDPQILGVTEQNFAPMATWRSGFARPYICSICVCSISLQKFLLYFSYCHKIESWR